MYICLLLGRVMAGYGQVPVNTDNSVEQIFLIFCGLLKLSLSFISVGEKCHTEGVSEVNSLDHTYK